jgi:hypothetical protein
MRRRRFLSASAALGLAALPGCAPGGSASPQGPTLLTVTGAIGEGNRGPLDPALDQMMVKQEVTFENAHAFDFHALRGLPSVTIRPTLEYDGRRYALSGPLLTDVLAEAGAEASGEGSVVLRAVDGYAVRVPLAEARRLGFIVATHLDGQPLPLGGLGPLWAVYEADRFPEMAARPVTERFILCPWGLYHAEVLAA